MVQNVTIEKYDDYREFLKDRFAAEKSRNRSFSYQYCAKKIQANKVYLKHIIDKKRHASLNKIPHLSRLFKLNEFENQYLLFLFLLCTTEDKTNQRYFADVLKSLRFQNDFTGNFRPNLTGGINLQNLFSTVSHVPEAQIQHVDTLVYIYDFGQAPYFIVMIQDQCSTVFAGRRFQSAPKNDRELLSYIQNETTLADFGPSYSFGQFSQSLGRRLIFSYATPGENQGATELVRAVIKMAVIELDEPDILKLMSSFIYYQQSESTPSTVEELAVPRIFNGRVLYPTLDKVPKWGRAARVLVEN